MLTTIITLTFAGLHVHPPSRLRRQGHGAPAWAERAVLEWWLSLGAPALSYPTYISFTNLLKLPFCTNRCVFFFQGPSTAGVAQPSESVMQASRSWAPSDPVPLGAQLVCFLLNDDQAAAAKACCSQGSSDTPTSRCPLDLASALFRAPTLSSGAGASAIIAAARAAGGGAGRKGDRVVSEAKFHDAASFAAEKKETAAAAEAEAARVAAEKQKGKEKREAGRAEKAAAAAAEKETLREEKKRKKAEEQAALPAKLPKKPRGGPGVKASAGGAAGASMSMSF